VLADEVDAGGIDKVPGRERHADVDELLTKVTRRREERDPRRRWINGPLSQAANEGKREASLEKRPAIHVCTILGRHTESAASGRRPPDISP
jgi:hypothetical protein